MPDHSSSFSEVPLACQGETSECTQGLEQSTPSSKGGGHLHFDKLARLYLFAFTFSLRRRLLLIMT